MSHPLPDPNPPAAVINRLRATTLAVTDHPETYRPETLANLHTGALTLAIATGDPRGYLRIVQALAVAQAALDAGETADTATTVIGLLDELAVITSWQRRGAAEALWRAQARAVGAADPHRSKP